MARIDPNTLKPLLIPQAQGIAPGKSLLRNCNPAGKKKPRTTPIGKIIRHAPKDLTRKEKLIKTSTALPAQKINANKRKVSAIQKTR